MGMAIDVETRQPIIGNIQGGLSGPAIRPIALLKVHQVYQECRERGIPIIGQGGIETANDALEFVLAGATTVGLGTALFYDPLAPLKVNAGARRVFAPASVRLDHGSRRRHRSGQGAEPGGQRLARKRARKSRR